MSFKALKIAGLSFALLGVVLTFNVPCAFADAKPSRPQVTLIRDDGNVKIIQAEALIDAPINTVWQELSNYGNMKNMMPGYECSTVMQAMGNVKMVDFKVKASGLVPAFQYQVKIHEDKPAYRFNIQRVSGDFKKIDASYQLISMDGGSRTRVLYSLSIDLGSGLPPFGVSSVLKTNTAKSMVALQSHCAGVYRRSLTAQANR